MANEQNFAEILRKALSNLKIPAPVQATEGAKDLSYFDYLEKLTEEERRGDEQNVVDRLLTPLLLECLGYEKADYRYNELNRAGKPDYVIAPGSTIAFFWEDKSTSAQLDPEDKQIARYATAVARVGILFNGKELIAIRRDGDNLHILLEVNLLEALDHCRAGVPRFVSDAAKEKLNLFYELFKKERFTGFEERIKALELSENDWKQQAHKINENNNLENFIKRVQPALEGLALMAHSHLDLALRKVQEFRTRMEHLESKWKTLLQDRQSGPSPSQLDDVIKKLERLTEKLGRIQDRQLTDLVLNLGNKAYQQRKFLEQLRDINNQARRLTTLYEPYLTVETRYAQWVELQRRFEEGSGMSEEGEKEEEVEFNRRRRFARQCAYVFFLKMLLVRILEDKGIIKHRLISDGGLEAWVRAVRPRFMSEHGQFGAGYLFEMALERSTAHYGQLLRPEPYDWFMPPDLSILEILEIVVDYDFSQLSTDLIGYTYQNFVKQSERHRLGHYLTPPEVVDYILDEVGYTSENREIIGKKVLDPACGSGSFLVHAASRYRQALDAYYRQTYNDPEQARSELAKRFLKDIQENFVGIDLNPFSCYLARINLLIQALDDYHFLQCRGEEPSIKGFQIYNGDSLVDYEAGELYQDELNELGRLKRQSKEQFGFVFANPPYVSPKQEDIGVGALRYDTFYSSWLSGDINTYILFICVGLHFLAPRGRLGYIIPLTILGDEQSENARRKLLTMTKPIAITRFYTEHVLFKGVQQAVAVLALEKDSNKERTLIIRGGGVGKSPEEAIEDARKREDFTLPFDDVSWWMSQESVPKSGVKKPNQQGDWENVWIVLPEKSKYYELWKSLVNGSSQTLHSLFEKLGLVQRKDFVSQGDVNTTHVEPFHVSQDHKAALPLYKGEMVDLLTPLPYPPEKGPKGRDPFVAPPENEKLGAEQQATAERLRRIAELQDANYGFVLRAVANMRLPRRLNGTLFERNQQFKPVFTHGLWVFRFRTCEGELAKALLGLLVSAPLNFAYSALSTNNNISTRLLFCLPVPGDFEKIAPILAQHVKHAFDASEKLQRLLKDYDGKLNITSSYTDGEVKLDPIKLLNKERVPKAKMEDYAARGYFTISDSDKERYKMKALLDRGDVNFTGGPTAAVETDAENVVRLWIDHYGDRKWDEFKELSVPDDPKDFLDKWKKKSQEAKNHLNDYLKSIEELDNAVADWYKVPDHLRPLLREGLPWTQGVQQNAKDDEESEEGEQGQSDGGGSASGL